MTNPKKGQTRITIYPDWCKACGLCVAFCPAKVLEIDVAAGCARAVREEECINCGFCELHCPDFAIVVTPRDKTRNGAARPRQDNGD
ncbi:4Fe-4S dicluster domain-containing protein [Desulfocurvus vexinensis]|uniref:4Fe-4S dicluster domain-containing protein n=1 Tax=Desulfocurvus vexinensis TaxID=399548 RepID=UPI00048BA850|nr:4Fe-4S dicluster domain-containing protein [Desulfocurvus vexinensis]